MARTRLLKPGFFKNADLARLSERHRLLFAGLWTIADRNGRLKDDPAWIRAELFPYEREINVEDLLSDLDRSGFIHRYEVNDRRKTSTVFPQTKSLKSPMRAIAIPKFTYHQHPHIREQKGEIPPPRSTDLGKVEHQPRLPVSDTVSDTVPKDKSSGAYAPPFPSQTRTVQIEAQQNIGVITKVAHEVIDLLGSESPDLQETVKGICAHRKITYDSTVVHKAIDSARVQRKRLVST